MTHGYVALLKEKDGQKWIEFPSFPEAVVFGNWEGKEAATRDAQKLLVSVLQLRIADGHGFPPADAEHLSGKNDVNENSDMLIVLLPALAIDGSGHRASGSAPPHNEVRGDIEDVLGHILRSASLSNKNFWYNTQIFKAASSFTERSVVAIEPKSRPVDNVNDSMPYLLFINAPDLSRQQLQSGRNQQYKRTNSK